MADGSPYRLLLVSPASGFTDRVIDTLQEGSLTVSVTVATTVDGIANEIDGFDCVVSGHDPPSIDGVDVLRAVHEGEPSMPFVLAPAVTDPEAAMAAVRLGATEYVPRPAFNGDWTSVLADRVTEAVSSASSSDVPDDPRFSSGIDRDGLEDALAAERQYTADVIEALDDVFYAVDGDGTLQRWNDRLEEVTGYTPDQLRGRSPTEFIDGLDEGWIDAAMDDLESDGRTSGAVELITSDGTAIPYEFTGTHLSVGDDVQMVGIGRDVSEREDRERRLRRSERRFRAVFEGAFDAMVLADDDGEYVEANSAAAELYGVDREDLLGRSVHEFAAPEYDVDAAWDEFLRDEDDRTDRGVFALERPDGEVRYTEFAATQDVLPGRHLSVLRDVTERIETRRELRETNERLEGIVEATPLAVAFLDADGTVDLWNPAAEELFGWTAEEVVGTAVTDLPVVPADAESQFTSVLGQTTGGDPVLGLAITPVTKSGDRLDVRLWTAPVHGGNGEVTGVVAVLEDVSDRKRYERALATLHGATRELVRAEDTDAVHRILADAAENVVDLPAVCTYEYDGDGLVPKVVTDSTAELLEPPAFPRGEGLAWNAFADGETGRFDDVHDHEGVYDEATPIRSELVVPLGTHGVLFALSRESANFDDTDVELAETLAANATTALDQVEKDAEILERDRELEARNEELSKLNRINGVIRNVNRALVQARTRESITNAVCDRLAESDPFAFAWIAEYDDLDGTLSPGARSGVEAAFTDRVASDPADPLTSLAREAAETGRVRIVQDVLDASGWESRRRDALTYGFQSIAAIPVSTDERTDGVLVVHAANADAFGERERAVLAELGAIVGTRLAAVGRTRAAMVDQRVEVELQIDDERLLYNRLSAGLDETVTVEGVVPERDGSLQAFVSTGAPADAVLDLIAEWKSVDDVARMSGTEDHALFRITTQTPPLIGALHREDAVVRSMESTDGSGTLLVELPGDADVRTMLSVVTDAYPDTELLARRERTAPMATPTTFRDRVQQACTERQYQALQTAYYGGFYEWPRQSTNEDLAATLGISSPTFQHHLRQAERKLVQEILG